jgi:hypothetical protein
VQRLTDDGVEHFMKLDLAKKKFTHVCLALKADGHPCNTPLALSRVKKANGQLGTYSTSAAVDHLKSTHPSLSVSVEALGRQDKKKMVIAIAMADQQPASSSAVIPAGSETNVGSSIAHGRLTQSVLSCYMLTPADKSKAAQARFYIDGCGRVSKNTFEDPAFIKLLKAHGGDTYFKLSRQELIHYVRAEYDVMVLMIKEMIRRKEDQSLGNACAQLQHDGGTAQNGVKHQAIGLAFVEPDFTRPIVIALGVITLTACDVSGQKTLKKHTDQNVAGAARDCWAIYSDSPITNVRARARASDALPRTPADLPRTRARAFRLRVGGRIGHLGLRGARRGQGARLRAGEVLDARHGQAPAVGRRLPHALEKRADGQPVQAGRRPVQRSAQRGQALQLWHQGRRAQADRARDDPGASRRAAPRRAAPRRTRFCF